MTTYICYCYKYSEDDIVNDLEQNGHSTILEKITNSRKTGSCNCEENHPDHR